MKQKVRRRLKKNPPLDNCVGCGVSFQEKEMKSKNMCRLCYYRSHRKNEKRYEPVKSDICLECKLSFTIVKKKCRNLCTYCYHRFCHPNGKKQVRRFNPVVGKDKSYLVEWVEKMRKQFWIADLFDLSDLIEVYTKLGGKFLSEDISSGKQLQMMFNYIICEYESEHIVSD